MVLKSKWKFKLACDVVTNLRHCTNYRVLCEVDKGLLKESCESTKFSFLPTLRRSASFVHFLVESQSFAAEICSKQQAKQEGVSLLPCGWRANGLRPPFVVGASYLRALIRLICIIGLSKNEE